MKSAQPLPEPGLAANSPVPAVKLVRKTVVELVVDELRAGILSGRFAPGHVLRQEALAEELGVSRIPLREAIRLLSSEGLIDLLPHKGAYVAMLSKEEVRDLFDLRLKLEPWLLSEACQHITPQVLAEATALAHAMDLADAKDWGQLNWALHELLYSCANRPTALAIVRSIHDKTGRYLSFQVVNAPIRQQAHIEHLALIELCRQGLADQAQAALEQHIRDAGAQVLAIVERLLDK